MRKLFGCILTLRLFFQANSHAAVVSVCDEASLRAAISAGGTVTFGCSGTIVLTQAVTVATDVVLDGTGAQVILSGEDKTRLFNLSPGVEFELRSLQLTRGLATHGGAISNEAGRLILKAVTVLSNTATPLIPGSASTNGPAAAGGIYSRAGTVIAINCVFASNKVYARNGAGLRNPARGGAICMDGGSLEISNCVFQNNTAEGGPGGGTPGGTILTQTWGADASGAAIYTDGTATAHRCRFLRNRASGGTGLSGNPSGSSGGFVNGGVIHNVGGLQLIECTFMNNVAAGGSGGLGANASGWEPFPSLPGGNGGGGGFIHGTVIFNAGWLSVANSTFATNAGSGGNGGTAGAGLGDAAHGGSGGYGGSALGGAMFITNSAAAFLTNCTIVGNTLTAGDGQPGSPGGPCSGIGCNGGSGGRGGNGGTGAGAGVYFAGGTGAVVHCTFEGNSVHGGTNGLGGAGGAGGFGGTSGSPGANGTAGASIGGALFTADSNVQAANSIFSRSQGSTNCSGPLSDLGVNISTDNSACFTNPASLTNLDPVLGTLADNGGPTMTLALSAASPAHNRGSNSFASFTDQRGVPRPQGAFCDIGAYEIGHLAIEKTDGVALMKYGAPPGRFYGLQGRANDSANWRDLGGSIAQGDGYARYGPLLLTNRVEIFRTLMP